MKISVVKFYFLVHLVINTNQVALQQQITVVFYFVLFIISCFFLILWETTESLFNFSRSFSTDHPITDPSDQRWPSFRGAARSRAAPTEDTEPGTWKGRRNSCGRTDCVCSTRTRAWWWTPGWETPGWQTLLWSVDGSQWKSQTMTCWHNTCKGKTVHHH